MRPSTRAKATDLEAESPANWPLSVPRTTRNTKIMEN
jgi:hypothetical protein